VQNNTHTATWTYTYNNFGEVLTATDALGNLANANPAYHTTSNVYDSQGNLISITGPSPDNGTTPGSHTTFGYDTFGRGFVTSVTDPLHHQTSMDYWLDSNGKPYGLIKHITDANGKQTYFEYDARGNRTLVEDALQRQTLYQYDGLDRVTLITYPDNSTQSFHYEPVRGHLDYVIDQNGNQTSYVYDDADRLTSVTDAQSSTTQYGYDADSKLTSITDALGHTTTYQYDRQTGFLQETLFPIATGQTTGPTESYSYDLAGNLSSRTDRNSQQMQYVYDELNRLIRQNWIGNGYSAAYHYDEASRLLSATDPTGTYSFTYDNMDRLLERSTEYSSLSSKAFSVGYTYDAASNRTAMTDAENGLTTYSYDPLNRLQSILDFNGNSFGFDYDDLSRRSSLTRPNGINTTYAYQPNTNFLASILHDLKGAILDGATYTDDNAGDRLGKMDRNTGAQYNYRYDNIYRLLGVSNGRRCSISDPCGAPRQCFFPPCPPPGPVPSESYTYDPVGNRLSDLAGTSYVYSNPWNRLDAAGNTSYSYDSNGNTLTKDDGTGTTQYTWDFENRLTQIALPGATGAATFQYDPFGRRIQKTFTVNGITSTTNYLYDGANIIEEVDDNGNQVARFSQGPGIDQPLSMTRGGVTSFYQQDGLGSVTSLSNSGGGTTDTYTYDAFGNLTGSMESTVNPFRYTGREFDAETGLYYYRARYYNPQIGRFISEDPLGFGGGDENFYAYVGNNPTNFRDPSGLIFCPNGWMFCPYVPPPPDPTHICKPGEHGGGFSESLCDPDGNYVGQQGLEDSSGIIFVGMGVVEGGLKMLEGEACETALMRQYRTGAGGRWGGPSTRLLNLRIASQLETRGFRIIGGAGRASEEWIPGPGGGTTGGTFVDITATNGTTTLRIQTINTLASGAPTAQEAAAIARIQAAFPNDKLIVIPKR
jgi:RHS repeat-associated protein